MSSLVFKTYLVFDAIRRAFFESGWLRSIWTGKIELRQGTLVSPLPWLSYPAIHFLNSLDLTGARIFEFGSGSSTRYWQGRVQSGEVTKYTAVENNIEFYRQNENNYFYFDNVALRPIRSDYFWYAEEAAFKPERPFDITIVDGPLLTHRLRELESAFQITDSTGLIIVDDSQWLTEELERFCEAHRFFRLDFAGHAPAVSYTKITSVLFREPYWFTAPRLFVPVGGMAEHPFPRI